jgi:hypothetical protein
MKNLKSKILNFSSIALTVTMLIDVQTCFGSSEQFKSIAGPIDLAAKLENIKIKYLRPTYLTISANSVNRLHFGKSRIIKIVGDSSEYGAILSKNGSDLFFTSNVRASEVINLTLLLANGEAMDLRLQVSNNPEPAIIDIDSSVKTKAETIENQEIREMVSAMALRLKRKYFVEEKNRLVPVPNKPGVILRQYIAYRYGDLQGAGFTLATKTKIKHKNKSISELLNYGELREIFKDILAISIINEDEKIFIIFKAKEGVDV